jgi:hypothetical protein
MVCVSEASHGTPGQPSDHPITIAGMNHHDCEPPTEARWIDAPMTWTCSECGDVWRVSPFLPPDPPQESDLAEGEFISPAEWVRIGKPEANTS